MGKLYYIDGRGDNSKQVFIKAVDEDTGNVTFTDRSAEAKDFGGEYYTDAQKKYMKRHYSEQYPQMNKLKIWD